MQKDRNRMIQLFAFFYFFDEWSKDSTSRFDTKKVSIIRQNVKLLMNDYAKQEGQVAFDAIVEETKKYDFGFISKEDDKHLLTDIEYQLNILKRAIKNIAENSTECQLCNKCDYKYCDWYSINRLISNDFKNSKKSCPFKKNVNDIFDLGGDL